jgi:hypothetical protein
MLFMKMSDRSPNVTRTMVSDPVRVPDRIMVMPFRVNRKNLRMAPPGQIAKLDLSAEYRRTRLINCVSNRRWARVVTLTAVVSAIAAVSAACSSHAGHMTPTSRSVTSSEPSTPPSTYGGVVGKASRQACLEDARTAQQASDLYQAAQSHPAASLDALVADGFLRSKPSLDHGYVISYDPATGKVTATGICAAP